MAGLFRVNRSLRNFSPGPGSSGIRQKESLGSPRVNPQDCRSDSIEAGKLARSNQNARDLLVACRCFVPASRSQAGGGYLVATSVLVNRSFRSASPFTGRTGSGRSGTACDAIGRQAARSVFSDLDRGLEWGVSFGLSKTCVSSNRSFRSSPGPEAGIYWPPRILSTRLSQVCHIPSVAELRRLSPYHPPRLPAGTLAP